MVSHLHSTGGGLADVGAALFTESKVEFAMVGEGSIFTVDQAAFFSTRVWQTPLLDTLYFRQFICLNLNRI